MGFPTHFPVNPQHWIGAGAERRREERGDGGSLYEPREGYQMMRVEAGELEEALREREERREPVTGVEFLRVQGVQGLRGAGVLTRGARDGGEGVCRGGMVCTG